MSEKFRNKYRNDSIRLQNWDYRSKAAYFITICTKDRVHYFGNVTNGKMVLSPIGVIANICWFEIKNHAKNIELGEFVIMPDHMHGILILTAGPDTNERDGGALSQKITDYPKPIGQQRFQNQGKNSISSIVGGYKSAVTKHARRLGFDFYWQPRFYDHIIRNDKSFENISNYIKNNPSKWGVTNRPIDDWTG